VKENLLYLIEAFKLWQVTKKY